MQKIPLTIDPTFRLQKQVAKLEIERTEDIAELKKRLQITEDSLAHQKELGGKILDGFEALVEIYKKTYDFKQLSEKATTDK